MPCTGFGKPPLLAAAATLGHHLPGAPGRRGASTVDAECRGGPMQPEDLILISVDDHIAEPADMFDAHVPARYRDRAPRVVVEAGAARSAPSLEMRKPL